MPLQYGDGIVLYDGVAMKQWKSDETRRFEFLDNGQDYTHPDHGAQYVYKVHRLDGKGDPEKDWSLFIKPGSAIAIGALKVLTESRPTLEGRTFDITKNIIKDKGDPKKDTRYEWVEVFPE